MQAIFAFRSLSIVILKSNRFRFKMKKVLFSAIMMAAAFSVASAGPGKRTKVSPAQLNKVTRMARPVEPTTAVKTTQSADYGGRLEKMLEKRGRSGANSVQDNISISTMGESVNPFSVVGNGKTNLYANPEINTVSFVRRGGPNDPAGSDGAAGNRIFFDVNTRGGLDGYWQVSKGPTYENDPYLPSPSGANMGARYPQGLVWSPPGSTDTAQAVLFSQIPVLDNTNGGWGGQARGWLKLAAGSTARQTYNSSELADPIHYIAEGMSVNPVTGHLFFVDPERDASGAAIVFNNRVTVYRMSYNSANNDWDSTITYIPFNASSVATSAMNFGPDGVTGYIVLLAQSPDYGVETVYAPFVSKTVDGGITWSEFHLVNLNPEASPEVDSLREQWMGSWVNFTGDGFIQSVPAGSPYSHKVEYSTSFDLDVTVDKYNYLHIFTQVMVGGFTDTLAAEGSVRSGLGQWVTDIFLGDPYYPNGFVMNGLQSFRGCYGECSSTAESFTEDIRPQTTRSWDGSVIGFCWFDTDTASYEPASDGSENSNPDFWIRTCKVDSIGKFRLTSQSRNKTKGSNAAGSMVCGNVSPYMLPSPTEDSTYIVPVSAALLSTFPGSTAAWPITHIYLDGVTVTAKDSGYPIRVRPIIITSNETKWGNSNSLSLALWPNPATSSLNATVFTPKTGDAFITVTNALGQVVDRRNIKTVAGDNKILINTSAYRSGIYFMNIAAGSQSISRRFVKD